MWGSRKVVEVVGLSSYFVIVVLGLSRCHGYCGFRIVGLFSNCFCPQSLVIPHPTSVPKKFTIYNLRHQSIFQPASPLPSSVLKHQTSNIGHPASDIGHPASDI
jgi:hypothetical protein